MEMLSKAVINIIRYSPFYGALLMQMSRFPDPKMKHPAGVCVRNGRIEMRYNPNIFSSYSLEQATGVLEHECLHVVMRHLVRQKDRSAIAMFGEEVYSVWNIATDMSVNPLIKKELPSTPLLPKQFGLCEGKDAEYYYDSLIEVRSEESWELPQPETIHQGEEYSNYGNVDSDSASKEDSSCAMNTSLKASGMMSDNGRWDNNNTNTETPGPAEEVARQDEGYSGRTGANSDSVSGEDDAAETNPPLKIPGMIGDHDGWDDNTNAESPELVEEVIRQAVMQAVQRAHQCHGKLPACIKEEIESWLRKPEVPWTSLLRRFVGRAARAGIRFTWKRESRRFGEEQKGKKTVRKLRIVIAMDTSGSISQEMLERFISEINAIARSYQSDITVIQCDAEIHEVEKLRRLKPHIPTIFGRGGTDFRPVFELVNRKPPSPNVLIYLTDLYGSFPSRAPGYPVIWVRTPDSSIDQVPFGKIIYMPQGGEG